MMGQNLDMFLQEWFVQPSSMPTRGLTEQEVDSHLC